MYYCNGAGGRRGGGRPRGNVRNILSGGGTVSLAFVVLMQIRNLLNVVNLVIKVDDSFQALSGQYLK